MTETTTLVIPQDRFNLAALASVEKLPETFDSMLELLKQSGIEIDHASAVIADEWPVIEKAKLINVPFVLATWTVSNPDDGENGQYIVCRGITEKGVRFRFADGSTGIMSQLVKLTRERLQNGSATPNAGLYVASGLTKSDYQFTGDDGKKQSATTYYINAAE